MSIRTARPLAPVVLFFFLFSFTAGCASTSEKVRDNPKAVLGSVGGAGVGAGIAAIAGASPAWIIGAALMGALVGGAVGRRMDQKDKRMAAEAAAEAFEHNRAGQQSVWNNPDSGNSGSITPTKTYQLANGQYCRQYEQKITIDGEEHETYGTACRRADGSWAIQS